LVSLGDLVFLPLASVAILTANEETDGQHIKLIQWLPHRQLIIASLLFSGIVAALIGFSQHVWQILVLRGLTALFSFGGLLASITLGEVVKEETGNQAFSLFATATFLGAMLGSMVGGYMAEPQGRVPFLGRVRVFEERPYIAPGLIMGSLTIVCAIAIWGFVPEVQI
jgi:MFS family permease